MNPTIDAGPGPDRDVGEQKAPRVERMADTASALEEHRSSLHRYFRRRVKRPEDAEDFVQDVFLRVLSTGPREEKIGSWRGFLLRAASNLLIDRHRRSETRMEHQHFAIGDDLHTDGTDNPERQLAAREELHALSEALKTLTPKARDAFLLVRVERLSHKEAAERLDIPSKAVSRHVERSLVRLAAMLDDVPMLADGEGAN